MGLDDVNLDNKLEWWGCGFVGATGDIGPKGTRKGGWGGGCGTGEGD